MFGVQPFDLTDLDWSPELWIACHDEDEQNARLAQHVWDDNGLDVPESFLQALLGFLGRKCNRSGSVVANQDRRARECIRANEFSRRHRGSHRILAAVDTAYPHCTPRLLS